jgi:hypothetical protein
LLTQNLLGRLRRAFLVATIIKILLMH